MYLESNLQPFIAFSEDSIADVLKKINKNKARIIFVVSEHAKLLGSVSDGDIRRWLISAQALDLTLSISKIMNCSVKSLSVTAKADTIFTFFKNSDGIECLPLVDDASHLLKIVFKSSDDISIGARKIASNQPAFIIAEIGNNHQGDINLAKKLVDLAIEAKADCVKFQMRDMQSLYKNQGDADDNAADLGTQYTLDLLTKYQLTNNELFEIFDYSKTRGILPLCTPWDLASLKVLEEYNMPAYKVASADFTNFELLEAIAKTGKPFFCSTGMSTETEIISTVKFLDALSSNFVLLHCNSTYPTPFKDVNLNYLTRLRKITGKLVGYSGHERGFEVPIAATALGACVIEKHFTLDKNLEGVDHKVSLLPDEFSAMVEHIRNIEAALGGKNKPRDISQGEMINRENLAKSLVAKTNLPKGSRITRDMIEVKSPGQGLQPNRIDELVGKVLARSIHKGDFFYPSDISGAVKKKAHYNFKRPFGVPARFHDYHQLVTGTNLDFVEFQSIL